MLALRLFWLLYLPIIFICASWRLDMKDWGFWMWLAYGMLAIAATITAADQGIKSTEGLKLSLSWLISNNIWAFSPILLIILATTLLLLHDFGYIVAATGVSEKKTEFVKWSDNYAPVSIVGKTFRNIEVELDGKYYSECKFYNVTFKYNGTAPIQFSHNSISGPILFKTDNQSILGTFAMLKGLKALGDNFAVYGPPGIEKQIDGSMVDQ